MKNMSLVRELSLLVLSQVSDNDKKVIQDFSLEIILQKVLDGLTHHLRDSLDTSACQLEAAQQLLVDNELNTSHVHNSTKRYLDSCFITLEKVLNGLSNSLEIPRLLILGDQESIRSSTLERVALVLENRKSLDFKLNEAMEGWRLKRLPKIDRDILRLALIDFIYLETPPAITCNEAVELANRYSDEQGRRMINGILRRIQNSSLVVN